MTLLKISFKIDFVLKSHLPVRYDPGGASVILVEYMAMNPNTILREIILNLFGPVYEKNIILNFVVLFDKLIID